MRFWPPNELTQDWRGLCGELNPEELEQRQAWGGAEHKYTHIGLANIRFRVEELAGGSLAVASWPGKGTLVTVRFPKTEGMAEKGSEDTCES